MEVQAELRRPAPAAALRAVQKPPAKPWRAGGPLASSAAPPPPPPKVYRVEPREFRDLVQRLTGAPPAASASTSTRLPIPQPPPQQPVPVRAAGSDHHQLYGGASSAASWFSFPMQGVDGGACSGSHM